MTDLPRIFGHRGAAGSAPENTLEGFEHALRLGARWIEFDVQAHPEGLLVFHDDTLERTTNGRGRLRDTPLAALRALDAGNGARIPLLQEVLTALHGRAGLNIELKPGARVGTRTAEALRAALDDGWTAEDLLVSSFDHAELRAFHEAAPTIAVAPLFEYTAARAVEVARALSTDTVHLGRRAATSAALRRLSEAGLRVHVYTINDPAAGRRLFDAGAAGIFTDYPERFVVTTA